MKNAVDAKVDAHTVTPSLWGKAALQNLKVSKGRKSFYSTRNQEPVWGAFGNNFAGFGLIAVPTRDFPGSSLYFNHNRNSFFKSGVFWPKTVGFWPKILKSLKIGPPTPTHNKHFHYAPPRTKRKLAHHPKPPCEEITIRPSLAILPSNSTH